MSEREILSIPIILSETHSCSVSFFQRMTESSESTAGSVEEDMFAFFF